MHNHCICRSGTAAPVKIRTASPFSKPDGADLLPFTSSVPHTLVLS
ncbi:hypothetical protein [Aquimarina hainanensis]